MAQKPCCTDNYGPFINWALLAVRIVVSVSMLSHGIPKLVSLFLGDFNFSDPIGLGPELSLVLATFAEFFCSIFILVGYRSRLAAIPLIITMLVALLIVHGDDSLLDHINILLYLFTCAILVHLGGGKFTLSYYFFMKKNSETV